MRARDKARNFSSPAFRFPYWTVHVFRINQPLEDIFGDAMEPIKHWLMQKSSTGAIVLLSVDQTVTLGNDTPSGATSSVRVTLDKIGGRWLVSDFTPV